MRKKREVQAIRTDALAVIDIRNDEDAGRLLHEQVRERIKEWVRQAGGSETKSRQVWAAAWEALQNAIRYGSEKGDQVRITLARDSDEIRIQVTQSKSWTGAHARLTNVQQKDTKCTEPKSDLGGLGTMSRVASKITVSNKDRTIEMRFSRSGL